MKISQKQLQMLFQIAVGSLPIVNGFGFSQDTRKELVEEILNQQDTNLIETNEVNE